jgi:hypothetical protein
VGTVGCSLAINLRTVSSKEMITMMLIGDIECCHCLCNLLTMTSKILSHSPAQWNDNSDLSSLGLNLTLCAPSTINLHLYISRKYDSNFDSSRSMTLTELVNINHHPSHDHIVIFPPLSPQINKP